MLSLIVPITVAYSSLVLSQPKAKRLFQQSAAIIERDTGIKLRPTYKRFRIPKWTGYERPYTFILNYYDWFEKAKRPGIRTVIIAPASYYEALKGVAMMGQAFICEDKAIIAYNDSAMWGLNTSMLTHELGHMLGSWHSAGQDIMNPDPAGTAYNLSWNIGFSPESVEQINHCMTTGKLAPQPSWEQVI